MAASVVTFIAGIAFIVIGILNRKGNISMLHEYHRNNLSEKDRIPFGKQVGLSMIVIGLGIIAFSVLFATGLRAGKDSVVLLGTALLLGAVIAGVVISVRATTKYNGEFL